MSDIKIVQLQDHATKENVTPYVAASAVYYQYTEEGQVKQTNMETVYGSIDVNKILEAQDAAVSAINSQADASVEKIQTEGASYQNSIDELDRMIQRIENKAFPLEVATSFSGNTTTEKNHYSYSLTEDGLPASGASVTVAEAINSPAYTTVYTGSASSWTRPASGSTMHPGTDTYKFVATKGEKRVEKIDTRHLWFYGSYNSTITTGDEVANRLNRMFTDKGEFEVQTTVSSTTWAYIWIVVPVDATLESVTSDGIEVTLNAPTNLQVTIDTSASTPEYATYKAYRTVKALAKDSVWDLLVKIA